MPTAHETERALSNQAGDGHPTKLSEQTSRLSEQSSKVAEDVREFGQVALDTAGEALKTVKRRGGESLDRGRERVGAARDGLEGYVSDNPMRSVLIAAGVGALIGLGMRGRN